MDTNINVQFFKPNEEQKECIVKVTDFIIQHKPFSKLLINGSAGTGKTTIIISSIINILLEQLTSNDIIDFIIKENELENELEAKELYNNNNSHTYIKPWYNKLSINNFIVSAPTNKAKDVLFTKYNTFIEEQLQIIIDIKFLHLHPLLKSILNIATVIQILNSKIKFLTVSQVLSIGRVINEMGIEEFTKGNEKKITDKYNKGIHINTSIIVDECSMIDKNTARLLTLIKCQIIYIGDYCQLPPVNEDISTIFTLQNDISIECITLKLVERCKNDITLIANDLRDKIYDVVPLFNLLKYVYPDLIIYNKKFSVWLESYVNEIKQKQKNLIFIDTHLDTQPLVKQVTTYDTMALGWTNKCCSYLNSKIRGLLFNHIKNIDLHYIIKGDKLLIKTPYYKYDNHIYSSNIVYVSKVEKTIYKPINFKDWCDIIITLNDMYDLQNNKQKSLDSSLDININNMFDTTIEPTTKQSITKQSTTKQSTTKQSTTNIQNYFKSSTISNNTLDTSLLDTNTNTNTNNDNDKEIEKNKTELNYHRKLFYTKHILTDIITTNQYNFTDEISLKYNLIVQGYNLHDIKNLQSLPMRSYAYTKWHKAVSNKLFGIPNDHISCKKCAFFVKKFNDKLNNKSLESNYISEFIDATNNLEFEMYSCDLVTFNTNGKTISSNIPILNMLKKNNLESLEIIRNIIKNSFEVKIMLSKQDELILNLINKTIGEEGESVTKNIKYITMSQMFGHYMSHVITSNYLEVDYGYALTVHKSQGSTYDNVYLEYSNILSNSKDFEKHKLLYTAITRGINKLHIYY